MHNAATDFLIKEALDYTPCYREGRGLDLGGISDPNTPRRFWPNLRWDVVNPYLNFYGKGIQMRGIHAHYLKEDATCFNPAYEYDLVICTEVFEHVKDWPKICDVAFQALKNDAYFFVTCAGPGRPPHHMHHGGNALPGEHYAYILPHVLGNALRSSGFLCKVLNDPIEGDVYAIAHKP